MNILDETDDAARFVALGGDLDTLPDRGALFDARVFYRAAELHAEAMEKSAAVARFKDGDEVSRSTMSYDDVNVVEAARRSAESTFKKFFN